MHDPDHSRGEARSWRALLTDLLRHPWTPALAAAAVLFVVGIDWGLPASDGWDNDGIAPRDFLAGLVQTFTPGQYFTYPPVHLVILGVLTAPVTLIALASAKSLAPGDVVAEMLRVPNMTVVAFVARGATAVMALGTLWSLAATTAEISRPEDARRAGVFTILAGAANLSLTYYAHTTNLDVPYLFWASLGLLSLVRAIARREPRRLRHVAILAVLAVGTKDQAYALFLLSGPAALLLWVLLDAPARASLRPLLRELAVAIAVGAGLLALCDGVLWNPTGFRARLAFLVGPASQDFVHYSNDWLGRYYVLRDLISHHDHYYPAVFGVLIAGGLAVHVARARASRPRLVAGLVPLLAALSFTAAFNCVARRTDHRFLLPQYALAAVYAGISLDALWRALRPGPLAWVGRAAAAWALLRGAAMSAAVDANLVLDSRYDAERWMAANVPPGSTIETYGLNVYLPRFPTAAKVTRVGPEPEGKRNPMPGFIEQRAAFPDVEARGPRFIVISSGWVWRYLLDPKATPASGRILPPTQIETGADVPNARYFQDLVAGKLKWKLVHASEWKSDLWPVLDIHASTGQKIWIYERAP